LFRPLFFSNPLLKKDNFHSEPPSPLQGPPTSELRENVDPEMTAGSLALNADVAAAVLSALEGDFAQNGYTDITSHGCSVGGKLALRTAWASDVITSVIAVNAGGGGAASDGVSGVCGETVPHLGHPQRWHNWVSQDKSVRWDERNGGMENFLAGLLDKKKTLYLVSSARDDWANPLGSWAAYRAAPLFAESEDAADRLLMKTYDDSNHCGFGPGSFDLSEFTSTEPCHMYDFECALVDEWLALGCIGGTAGACTASCPPSPSSGFDRCSSQCNKFCL
jgi:hypothetical protein